MKWSAYLVWILLSPLGYPSAFAAEAKEAKVVVGQAITLAPKLQKHRAGIWKEIVAAGHEQGFSAVKAEGLAGACTAKECPQDFALREDANTVLWIEGAYSASGFNVSVRIWAKQGPSDAGAWLGEYTGACELCTGPEFATTVGQNVRKALAAEKERQEAAAAPPPPPPPPILVVPPPAPEPAPPSVKAPTLVRPSIGWEPWAVIGAGAVVTGLGIGLWATDGKETGCAEGICRKTYNTKGVGMLTTGIGVATLLAGGAWIGWRASADTRVAFGPGTIYLAGKY